MKSPVIMVQTDRQGENFVHPLLWEVAQRQIDHAKATPIGSMYDHLASMVFVFHAFEAYLNYVGERLDSTFWANEREHFRESGFAGKVAKVFEKCGLKEPHRGRRPYQTLWVLKGIRDEIAHGRVYHFKSSKTHSRDKEQPIFPESPFANRVTPRMAERALADIHSVALAIHTAARPKVKDIWFTDDPFHMAHGHANSSTKLVS